MKTKDKSRRTVTGAQHLYLYRPTVLADPAAVEEVNLLDIAHALSNSCRFTGHVKAFYSVAQHSVHVSHNVPPEQALAALLHDASEAYLADIARPVKMQMEFYKQAEARLEGVISQAFNLPAPPMSAEIKNADNRMLVTEKRDLLIRSGDFSKIHTGDVQPYEFTIYPLLPTQAKQLFLLRFAEITTGYVPGSCESGVCKTYAEDFIVDIAKQLANVQI
jgi:5'-deoxynucleotidase YfbR-like HD superfamily hydrolase